MKNGLQSPMNYYRVMIPNLNVDDDKGMEQRSSPNRSNSPWWIALPAENTRLEKPALFIASGGDYIWALDNAGEERAV